jgi:hypothetical protein
MVEAPHQVAEVAEQADASVSKTDVRKDVRVRLPISAPIRVCGGVLDERIFARGR